MIEWGRWRYSGMPSIGDYIQVDGVVKGTGTDVREEGFVTEVRDGIVKLHLEKYDEYGVRACRWRRSIDGDLDEETRTTEREKEDVL